MDSWNSTSSDPGSNAEAHWLKPYYDKSVLSILILIMFSMGCTIRPKELFNHLRKPWSVVIGLFSQFVLLPATAFVVMQFFSIKGYFALGMLILACSPSGTTSNVFTYYLDGDVPLSISMTVCSTIVAMLMMPFNMWIYGRSLENHFGINIPYVKMIKSLTFVTTPAAVGMLIYYKTPKIAAYITKIGSLAGFAMIGVSQVMIYIIYPNILTLVPIEVFLAVAILPLAGLAVGYAFAAMTRRSVPVCRTISIECGIQNVGMAITVVTMTIEKSQAEALVFPLCYSYCMITICAVSCICYNVYMKITKNNTLSRIEDPAEKKMIPDTIVETEEDPSDLAQYKSVRQL